MEIKVLAFGIARDIIKASEIKLELSEQSTVDEVKDSLVKLYPDFNALRNFAIAVNCEYVEDSAPVKQGDEIVIIPPVSGG